MSTNNLRIREDGVHASSPHRAAGKSALVPLMVLALIAVVLWLLADKQADKPAPELTEEQEKDERKADLIRVREDFTRNQQPPIDGIARYQENVQ